MLIRKSCYKNLIHVSAFKKKIKAIFQLQPFLTVTEKQITTVYIIIEDAYMEKVILPSVSQMK